MSFERYRPVCNDVEMFCLYNYEKTKAKLAAAKKDMKKADEEYMKADQNYYDKKLALEQITVKKDSDSKLVKRLRRTDLCVWLLPRRRRPQRGSLTTSPCMWTRTGTR